MKRITLKSIGIAIAALSITFLFGSGATWVSNRVFIRFELEAMGSYVLPPNGRGGFNLYRASDGVQLSFIRVGFPTVEEAKQGFQTTLKHSKISSREALHDREGKLVVGEKVLALTPGDGGEWPMLVCLDGMKVYAITSSSQRHILIFEEQRCRY